MMGHRPRILFVHNSRMPFVQRDLTILRDRYAVTELYMPRWHLSPGRVLAEVVRHDLVFGWFASRHSVWPVTAARLFGKPSCLVVGGYDVARVPEIGYGHQRGGPTKWASRLALGAATRLLAIAKYARDEAVRNAGVSPAKLAVVYLGLDASRFPAPDPAAKEPVVLTIGNVNRSNLTRKGLEPFVRAASLMPDISFVLVGRFEDDAESYLRGIATPNVKLTGFLTDEALRGYLRKARVYVQASRHEGFGLAMAEAMLSGCVPVVTRVGAVPEVVADTGVYLPAPTPRDVASGVRAALALGEFQGRLARERIIREFPLAKRREGLYREIDRLLVARSGLRETSVQSGLTEID